MRWHRLCRDCTPVAARDEVPNEIDTREFIRDDTGHPTLTGPVPNWNAEFNRHWPEEP
jgi:hypothetical protein